MTSKKKQNPNDKIYRTIRTAMKACQKKGIKIAPDTWGTVMDTEEACFVPASTHHGEVCALGALLVHKDGSIKFDKFRGRRELTEVEEDETAAYVLGVDTDWVSAFISGFDGDNRAYKKPDRKSAYEMGKKLREEFVHDVF